MAPIISKRFNNCLIPHPLSKLLVGRARQLRMVLLRWTLLGAALVMLPAMAAAAEVTLAWDANDPVPDGYRLFMRLDGAAYNYSQPVWSGPQTTCTVADVPDGATCYFVVRAYRGTEESGDSNEVTYSPAAVNQPPVASAGSDQSAASQSQVTLNGSGSRDPEGGVLTYNWRQTAGPSVQLSANTAIRPSFTTPLATRTAILITFELTVSDAAGLSDTDTCTVEVLPAGQTDSDGDGFADDVDAFPHNASEWLDTDGDGVGNNADTDDDNDHVSDSQDAFPLNASEWQDTDGDGIGNVQDLDDDGDGMPDNWELANGLDPLTNDAGLDPDGDGYSNIEEYESGTNPFTIEGNQPPDRPDLMLSEDDPNQVTLTPKFEISAFSDPDVDDSHLKTQWQIIETGSDLIVLDVSSENKNLNRMKVSRLVLDPQTHYACQVRVFDQHGEASEWSTPLEFTTIGLGGDLNNDGFIDPTGAAPIATDLNADGILDSLQTDIIRNVQNPTTLETAGIGIEESDTAESVVFAIALDPEDLDSELTVDETTPYGVLGYKIKMTDEGQAAVVTVYLPGGNDPQSQWRCIDSDSEVVDCTSQVDTIDDGTIALRTAIDGGPFDADGVANGVIVEYLIPTRATTEVVTPPENSSTLPTSTASENPALTGSDAGGCFIGSLF